MNINRFRKHLKLSQQDVASKLGVDQSTIQRLESLHHTAKITNYIKYAEVFGVGLGELFSDEIGPEEIAIVKAFREIPVERRNEVLLILDLVRGNGASVAQEKASSQTGRA